MNENRSTTVNNNNSNNKITREVPVCSTNEVSDPYDMKSDINSDSSGKFRGCSRYISVEPAVVGCMFIMTLYSILSKEYIRQRLARGYKLDVNDTVSSCNKTAMNRSDPNYILQEKVSAETASWVLYLSLCNFLPGLLSSIVLGSWSDKVGRKIPMLVSLTGIIILVTMYLVVILFTLPLHFLFIGHILCGLSGDFGNVLACSFSHLSDVSDAKARSVKMAILETCIGIGGFVSSVTSGAWDLNASFQNPFWCMLGIAVFNLLCTLVLVPSTADKNISRNIRHLFSKEPFQHMLQVIKYRRGDRHIILILYAICFCLLIATMSGARGLLIVYEIGVPFCWNSLLVGLAGGFSQIGCFVSLILLKLIPAFSAEPKLLMLGVITSLISYAIFALSWESWALLVGLVFQLFFNIPSPILRSQSSRLVFPYEVGSVFAIFACAMSVGSTLGSMAFEGLFALTASSALPGAAFFMGTGLLLLFIPLYCIGYRKSRLSSWNGLQYDTLIDEPDDCS